VGEGGVTDVCSLQSTIKCMSGDGGRVVIRLHTDPENQGTGVYQLLTPWAPASTAAAPSSG
jgi:hypothetical protein